MLIASESRIGRIRRSVKRGFIVSDGKPITIRHVLVRAYPRLSRFTSWHYLAARRAVPRGNCDWASTLWSRTSQLMGAKEQPMMRLEYCYTS